MKSAILSVMTSIKPALLTKTFSMQDGRLVKTSGGNMIEGSVKVVEIKDLNELAGLITSLGPDQALCYGAPIDVKIGEERRILPFSMITPGIDAIARTNANFEWPSDASGILMIDYDPAPGETPLSREELTAVIIRSVPELREVEMLWVPSSSSYIYNSETDEEINGLRGQRLYLMVDDARDIPRIGEIMFQRLWLGGHGRIEVGRAGQLLVRATIDDSVYQQSRLDFAAGAYCVPPVEQRRGAPQVLSGSIKILEQRCIEDLSVKETLKYKSLVSAAKRKHKPEAEKVQKARVEEKVAEHPPEEQANARVRYAKAYENGELSGDFMITIIDGSSETRFSVDEILENAEEFDKLRTLDPVEPDYNDYDDVGILNLSSASPNLYSHAHGGRMYFLKASVAAEAQGIKAREIYNPYKNTDMGNSERFHELASGDIKFVEELGWLLWNGKFWEVNPMGVKELYKHTVIDRIYRELAEKASQHNSDAVKELNKWAKRSESDSQIASAMRCASSISGIRAKIEDFDKNLKLLNIENGTVDLTTGELKRHDRKDLITKLAPVVHDADAKAPVWLNFLDRIFENDQEQIAFVQRALGYSITGGTEGDCWFILHGVGANGKSVLLNNILDMMGSYAGQAAPDLLMQPRGGSDRHPTELADLMARRFVVCQESEEGRRLAEASVKRMTTSDRIKARYMCKDFFEFVPTHKLWLATNHVPVVRDTTESTWRRIRMISFNVVIPPEERDPNLLQKLKSEWPGILNWVVAGCLEYQKVGLQPPPKVLVATAEYRQSQDSFAVFLNEYCYEDAGALTSRKDLYASYQHWCEKSGEYCKSGRLFSQALIEREYKRQHKNSGEYYWGIGLKIGLNGKLTEEYQRKALKETQEELRRRGETKIDTDDGDSDNDIDLSNIF